MPAPTGARYPQGTVGEFTAKTSFLANVSSLDMKPTVSLKMSLGYKLSICVVPTDTSMWSIQKGVGGTAWADTSVLFTENRSRTFFNIPTLEGSSKSRKVPEDLQTPLLLPERIGR